jgi:putative methionine-R-sulfoxide reductase with GAF domain
VIFFENRSLKRLAIYLLAGTFLLFSAEYFTIRYKIEGLEEIEEKKDFARGAQLSGQQIALMVQQYLNDQPNLAPEIVSRIDEQDHLLKIINEGGRMDGTDVFLKPLSRLPAISFKQLNDAWGKYKANVISITVDKLDPATPEGAKARTLLPAQWLTLSNWFKKLEIDLTEEANAKKSSVENWVFAFIIFDWLLLTAVFYLFHRYIIRPLRALEKNTIGHQQDFNIEPNEIGKLKHQVNEILEQLKDATDFVASIGEGKLDFDYKNLDSQYSQGKNRLADSLISMQAKLKDMSLEEHRRQWANEGLTKFVDILRSSNNINTLGDKIISALVQYTGSNQGGLYILNDEDPSNKHLELISLFAFNTKKFERQKIKLGEGILGQTFLEKQTTLLTEIPDEFVRITSGLGDANPKSLLVVPLKVDTEIYGVVELASFKNYQPHEISFVEKLAETIASTLSSVKAAQKNMHLIEQFQQQTEEMRAQEEEMRQNMEELQATQEEMGRKEGDYISRIRQLESLVEKTNEAEKILDQLRHELSIKERSYQEQLRQLETKLAQKPPKSDDWATAEELEKTLRIQMEALKIMTEESTKR